MILHDGEEMKRCPAGPPAEGEGSRLRVLKRESESVGSCAQCPSVFPKHLKEYRLRTLQIHIKDRDVRIVIGATETFMLPLGHPLKHQAFPRHLAFILDEHALIVAQPRFADLWHGFQLFRCASRRNSRLRRYRLLYSPSWLHFVGLYPA